MKDKDIYVIVAENNVPLWVMGEKYIDDKGPLVFEQYTRTANFQSIKKRAEQIAIRYGTCRIAKLQFIEERL